MKDNNNNIADDAKAEEIADCTASNNNECPMTDELVEQVAQHEDTKIEEQCSSESNIEDNDKSFYIDFINKSNFYLLERKELLEIVLQYNELFETINSLNNKLDLIKTEVLKANLLYDDFKRNFATIVDTCPWFEKLYYALPIFEDYDDDDVWISQWCKTVQAAVTEDNRNNLRNFINKNLFNSIYTLPKEVYCYKVNSKETKGVNEETAKFVFLLASRIARYIKYIKDTSDQLRCSMQKALTAEPIKSALDFGKVKVLPEEEINADLASIEHILSKDNDIDKGCEVIQKYKLLNLDNSKIFDNQEEFIAFARSTYQEVLNFQNILNSISKQVYTSSLLDIYKLYGEVSISFNDLNKVQSFLSDADEKSNLFTNRIGTFILEMQELIEKYLKESYNIRPLKEIHVGVNFNSLDVNWYDSSGSEPAPNKELVECISSISDMGFAKYNSDNEVEFVTKPARIFVYSKQIINADASEA